jgi:hypothetical protein
MLVERKVAVGMTKQQVIEALSLPQDTMKTCVRLAKDGGTEVEIVGSSPPWRSLRPGYHTIVLRFDGNDRVVGGYGIWWDEECSDDDVLQLMP